MENKLEQRHPFPQMSRENYRLLDGKWKFRADKDDRGESEHWYEGFDSDEFFLFHFHFASLL